MYAFDIIIKNNHFKKKHDSQYENWVHGAFDYVYHLERTGQIIKNNHQIIVNENSIKIPVICPEKDSMAEKYCSVYSLEVIQQIEKNAGSKIETVYRGRDADNPHYKVPENSSFYVLRNGWESPLLCGDTHKPIPFYKIPCTDHGGVDYDNLYFWNQDYQRLSGLWLSSGAYEEFAQQQLQDHSSDINKTGQELCVLIEKLTGTPCYYFLFNYRNLTESQDKNRACPVCQGQWYIDGKTATDFMAFKCDPCQLVSELSTNSEADP